ncbi:MAG: histidine phosphatase family protein [Candidatus Eremiobacterota bacterium]
MSKNGSLRFIFVRHGETTGNSSIRFFGKTDIPLSDEGQEQMRAAGEVLKTEHFDVIFTSTLCRTIEGARIIAGNRNIPLYPMIEFREIDFGIWEGLTLEEIEEKDPVLFAEWRKDFWKFDYPEGDIRNEFIEKVKSGIDNVLNKINKGTVLLVLHKGIIRTAIYYLLGNLDNHHKSFQADLGSIHELERINGKWNYKKINYTEHLPK